MIGGLILGRPGGAYFTRFGFYIGNYGVTGMLLRRPHLRPPDAAERRHLTIVTYVITLIASLYPALLAAHGTRRGLHAQ